MGLRLLRLPSNVGEVAALWYEPRRPRGVSLVVGHGYSSSKQSLDSLCGFLAGHGFAVISVDFPGHLLGATGGRLNGLRDLTETLAAGVAYARTAYAGSPIYTIGHSMGAVTALHLCAYDPQIAGAVAIATGWGRVRALASLRERGVTDLRSAYVEGLSLPELMADIEPRMETMLPLLQGRPTLYVAADRDALVTLESARELYDRSPEPHRFVTIESDHTYAGERARGVVLAWLNELHPRAT